MLHSMICNNIVCYTMPSSDPSMGHLLNWAARLLRRLADRRLEPLGLSSGYLPVLTALIANGAMSQKALTRHAAIEQPTMAATLARMERDAIIERQPDPHDKRVSLFSLTPATRQKVEALHATVEGMNADTLSGLPEGDRDRFRHMLQTVVATLERACQE